MEQEKEQGVFKTPEKQREQNELQSPSFLYLVKGWKNSLEKYQNGMFTTYKDPEIVKTINQMNETIQQTSWQQETSREKINEQSFSQNQSCINHDQFQLLNDLMQRVQYETQQAQQNTLNQSFQSPRTNNDFSKCNETLSEIKKQVFEVGKSYKRINDNILDKDDELQFLSQQLEKDYSTGRQTRQIKSAEIPQGEVIQKYNMVKQARNRKIKSFGKYQMKEINEFRQSLTQLKTEVQEELPKQISRFQDEVQNMTEKFQTQFENKQLKNLKQQFCDDLNNPQNQFKFNDQKETEIFSIYYQLRDSYQQQIYNLNDKLKNQMNEFTQQMQNSNKEPAIEQNLWQEILNHCNLQGMQEDQQFLTKIIQTLYQKIQQNQNDLQNQEMKQENSELCKKQLQEQLNQKDIEIKNNLETIKTGQTQNQQQAEQINQLNNQITELAQKIEEYNQKNLVNQINEMVPIIQQSMKQEQQLIYIGLKIFQQFLTLISIDKKLLQVFRSQIDQLTEYQNKFSQVNVSDQVNDAIMLMKQNSTIVDEIIEQVCNEYRLQIQNMKESQEEWIKQFQ